MPQLPSMGALISAARTSLDRFPETVTVGIVAALYGMWLVLGHSDGKWHRFELLAVLALGIPLTFAVAAVAESRAEPGGSSHPRWRAVALLMVFALLAILFASRWFQAETAFAWRFAVIAVAAHLAVAYLPYLGRGRDDGFWEYNHGLLERFTVAVIYSIVLFVGLAVALGTAQVLFRWKLGVEAYGRIWIAVVFAFNTWVFVGGLRTPLAPADPRATYPSSLRVFTQFLLLPLVTLYLAILYAYMVQILIQREWPRGTVGWMVSGLSAAGMLAYLLVHPIREASENRWVRIYSRRFFFLLLPLIGLLLLGAWRRIREYGVTEPRYLLVALGLWIAAISIYFLASRRRDIRVIPVSLGAMLLLTTFGPWGAAGVSARDQLARLTHKLEGLAILRDGHAQAAPNSVSVADRRVISGALEYLNRMHPDRLRRWFEPKAPDAWNRSTDPQSVLEAVGLRYLGSYDPEGGARFTLMSTIDQGDSTQSIPIAGYDALMRITLGEWNGAGEDSMRVRVADRLMTIRLVDQGRSLEVTDGREVLSIPIQPLIERARRHSPQVQVPAAEMFVAAQGAHLEAAFAFESIQGREPAAAGAGTPSAPSIDQLTGTVLIRVK